MQLAGASRPERAPYPGPVFDGSLSNAGQGGGRPQEQPRWPQQDQGLGTESACEQPGLVSGATRPHQRLCSAASRHACAHLSALPCRTPGQPGHGKPAAAIPAPGHVSGCTASTAAASSAAAAPPLTGAALHAAWPPADALWQSLPGSALVTATTAAQQAASIVPRAAGRQTASATP